MAPTHRSRAAARALAVVVTLGVAAVPALAQTQTGTQRARAAGARAGTPSVDIYRVTRADSLLVGGVIDRLIAVTPRPDVGYPWPPSWRIAVSDRDSSEINAFATPDGEVLITPPMLNLLVKGNADYLAAVLGHELGHHILHHVTEENDAKNSNPILGQSGYRANESSADSLGAILAVRAGYSWTKILQGMIGEQDAPGQDYSSAQAVLFADHPAMANRAAFLNAIRGDRKQFTLWREMDAFHNGNMFLLDEQYALAASAYQAVAKEFPDAAEAWANVGFAKLMQYCDALDSADVQRFGITPPMVPAFYRRPASLEAKVRGIDQSLWYDAVGALRHAVKLDPTLALAKTNLALAYLVHPSGKSDLATATSFIRDAMATAAKDSILTDENRLAIYVNAGVIDMASDRMANAAQDFASARALLSDMSDYEAQPYLRGFLANEGLLLSTSSSRDTAAAGLKEMQKWMANTSSASPWWSPMYERYASRARALGFQPADASALQKRVGKSVRRMVTITLADGKIITLGEPTGDVTARLGAGTVIPVAGTDVSWISWPSKGVRILAGTEVLDIIVGGDNAPALTVKQANTIGAPAMRLTIGMAASDLLPVLGEDFEYKRLDPDMPAYRYYRGSGLGVRVRTGKVVEFIIGPAPRSDD